jgi:hypothetical protein
MDNFCPSFSEIYQGKYSIEWIVDRVQPSNEGVRTPSLICIFLIFNGRTKIIENFAL